MRDLRDTSSTHDETTTQQSRLFRAIVSLGFGSGGVAATTQTHVHQLQRLAARERTTAVYSDLTVGIVKMAAFMACEYTHTHTQTHRRRRKKCISARVPSQSQSQSASSSPSSPSSFSLFRSNSMLPCWCCCCRGERTDRTIHPEKSRLYYICVYMV